MTKQRAHPMGMGPVSVRDSARSQYGKPTAWAYGLNFSGVDAPGMVFPPQPGSPLTVHVRWRDTWTVDLATSYGEDAAVVQVGDGGVVMDRRLGLVDICSRRPIPPDVLVHPYLAGVGGMFSIWLGRETFHAGAFVAAGGAWVVAGQKEAGKSTMLAALSELGVPILCDDLVVVEDGVVYAGPRCIDLRPSTAERLKGHARLTPSRTGSRLRLPLRDAPREAKLRGWLMLGWGDDLVRRLSPTERIFRIARHRSLHRPPADPAVLVELAALPTWEVLRPARWDRLDETASRLLDLASSAG